MLQIVALLSKTVTKKKIDSNNDLLESILLQLTCTISLSRILHIQTKYFHHLQVDLPQSGPIVEEEKSCISCRIFDQTFLQTVRLFYKRYDFLITSTTLFQTDKEPFLHVRNGSFHILTYYFFTCSANFFVLS